MTLVKTDFGCKQAIAIKHFKITITIFTTTAAARDIISHQIKSENQMISTAVRQVCSYQSLLERFALLQLLQGTSVLVRDRLRYAVVGPIRVLRICSLHIYRTQYQQKQIRKQAFWKQSLIFLCCRDTQRLFGFKDALNNTFWYYCISHLCHHYKAIFWQRKPI